jgi:hypothetical protein
MTSSGVKVIPADAGDVSSADATSAEPAHVTSAEAANVASAEAAHVTAAETAAHMACAPVATRLPASSAIAKIVMNRPRMIYLHLYGRMLRHRIFVRCLSRQPLTSRWRGDVDCCSSALLNSPSIHRDEYRDFEPKEKCWIGSRS